MREQIIRDDGTAINVTTETFNSNTLGIVFPGLRYPLSAPLLYYSRNALFELGIDYIGFSLDYVENPFFSDLDREGQHNYMMSDRKLIEDFLVSLSHDYRHLVLVGKSMGTNFIRTLLNSEILSKVRAIVLFTPWNEWNDTIPEVINSGIPTFAIGPTNDKMWFVPNLDKLRESESCSVHEVVGADHSIEVNNLAQDLENLVGISTKVLKFIDQKTRGFR